MPDAPRPPHVAVIGGGFCGTFFAVQLARHAQAPLKISVVEPRETLGGGVAYSTQDPAHRLNVPAARMILFAETPHHFSDWIKRTGELAADPESLWRDGHAYPRRAAFGRYIADVLEAQRQARADATIMHIKDFAIAVTRRGDVYEVALQDGQPLEADVVVLAASHPPPRPPAAIAGPLAGDPALIADPWRPGALNGIAGQARVLIIGVGLTMADVVASLHQRGHQGRITAYSRRGLLPRGQLQDPLPASFTWFGTNNPPADVLALLIQVRELVANAARRDVPWQAVFDDIRANGQRLWRGLDQTQRRRFLRHVRVFWDAHRYRMAPQAEDILRRKQQDGSFQVLAASLVSIGRAQDGLRDGIDVVLQPRRYPAEQRLTVDHVVIATGPNHAGVVTQNPVLQSLAAQGLLQADCLGLGIAVDALGQVINGDGVSEPGLLVAGPLAREQYGELMGMPQVSAQPNAVAEHVAKMLGQRRS